MRKPPTAGLKNVPANVPPKDGYVTLERKYNLITPVFGGGVKAGENDLTTFINGKSVRGQLRFWWRATSSAQFETASDMREVEEEIWGAASSDDRKLPSQIQITVSDFSRENEGSPFEVIEKHRRDGTKAPALKNNEEIAPSYATFPLQPQGQEARTVGWKSKEVALGSFTIHLKYPSRYDEDVRSALWAWEAFGGIGARTRRGFGAIELIGSRADRVENELGSLGDTTNAVLERLRGEDFVDYVAEGAGLSGVPHLTRNTIFKLTRITGNAHQGWTELINALKKFRQERNPGNHPKPASRSRWPEPDNIRHITGQEYPGHDRPICQIDDVYPRGAFGLPIVFQFDTNRHGSYEESTDPRKTQLQLEKHDRWASPLILKPLALGNGKYVGIALYLEGSQPDSDLALYTAERNDRSLIRDHLTYKLLPRQAALITKSNGTTPHLKGKSDVILAFLETL